MGIDINTLDRASVRRQRKWHVCAWPPVFDPKKAPGDEAALIEQRLMDLEALPFDFDWQSIPDAERPRLLPMQSDFGYDRKKKPKFYWCSGPVFQPYGGTLDWYATSGGGGTLEDQIASGRAKDGLCPLCHVPYFTTCYGGDTGKRMAETGYCFSCAHYSDAIRGWQNKTIIGGHIYGIGSDRKTGSFLGMGGRRFDVEFIEPSPYAGARVTTHDLWSGGGVPPYWRSQLQDTARFLGDADRANASGTICWNPSDNSLHPVYPPPSSLKNWKLKEDA